MASPPVAEIVRKWDRYDNDVEELIIELKDAVDNNYLPLKAERMKKLDSITGGDNRPSIQEFVDATQRDLGLAKH